MIKEALILILAMYTLPIIPAVGETVQTQTDTETKMLKEQLKKEGVMINTTPKIITI